ncbi:MAG: fatty acid desaturase, partial [Pseudomonadota bacterium]|nr:fatty acid desaturase [Pseudomonadota bacterium]
MSTETVTHRDMLRRLSAGEKRALTERSDWRGLGQLAGHLSLIGLCLWGNVVGEGAVRFAAMLGQGVGMVFLFTAMHECSHSTAFRSRQLNLAVGMLAGLTLLIGPKWFFYFHQDHHKFTQDPDRDPELGTPKPSGVGGYL